MVAKILIAKIDETADDDYAERYRGILNLARNRAPSATFTDLLEALGGMGSLILSDPKEKDDVVFNAGEPLKGFRKGAWPLSVDPSKLIVPPHKRHYRRTRDDVLFFNRVAFMVPDSNVPALVRVLKEFKTVVAVTAAEGGVCVVLSTSCDNYEEWQQWCKRLEADLSARGVHSEKISLHTLVPISQDSMGVGAVLFLA